jgi:hypothetical protein
LGSPEPKCMVPNPRILISRSQNFELPAPRQWRGGNCGPKSTVYPHNWHFLAQMSHPNPRKLHFSIPDYQIMCHIPLNCGAWPHHHVPLFPPPQLTMDISSINKVLVKLQHIQIDVSAHTWGQMINDGELHSACHHLCAACWVVNSALDCILDHSSGHKPTVSSKISTQSQSSEQKEQWTEHYFEHHCIYSYQATMLACSMYTAIRTSLPWSTEVLIDEDDHLSVT